ncbi:MAG: transcription antitermination factor NusB, partial [Candidatus Puniceispirillaceae bacterium]
MTDKQKFKPAAVRKRTGSRLAALQFCYSRQMSGDSFAHTLDGFRTSYLDEILKQLTIKKIDEEHFTALITGVDTETDRLDGQIEPLLRQGWTMARLGTHELSILRLG